MTWTPRQSEDLYNMPAWGQGYFGINDAGNVTATPSPGAEPIDLNALTADILRRGLDYEEMPDTGKKNGVLSDPRFSRSPTDPIDRHMKEANS